MSVSGLDPERFYVSAEAAHSAFERRGPCNGVLLDSGWKVDLILRKGLTEKDRPLRDGLA